MLYLPKVSLLCFHFGSLSLSLSCCFFKTSVSHSAYIRSLSYLSYAVSLRSLSLMLSVSEVWLICYAVTYTYIYNEGECHRSPRPFASNNTLAKHREHFVGGILVMNFLSQIAKTTISNIPLLNKLSTGYSLIITCH